MSVGPIHFGRVTQNLQAFNLLAALRSNNFGLFRVQNQIATGLQFSAPSDDPSGAATVGRIDLKLDRLKEINDNLRTANGSLNAADQAMSEAIDLLRDARSNASEAVGDTLSGDERTALATIVDSIVRQAVTIGNRKHLDSSLFSGHLGNRPAFEMINDGIVFHGDNGRMETIVDTDLSQDTFTISGHDFFGGFSPPIRGVDLNPAVSEDTRLSDLNGANGNGVRLGRIRVADAVGTTEIDLSSADTVGDVIDALNAGLPGGWDASINANSIRISNSGIAGNQITIEDLGGGRAAADLGLSTDGGIAAGGVDLDPRLTPRTPLSDLMGGGGLALTSGIQVRTGSTATTVSFAGATTVEDVLNALNQSNPGVAARISADGRSVEVMNRISGADLTIEENGGTTATALGIRSMNLLTRLADLNDGRGVDTVAGNDIRINTRSGAAIEIDVDGADTLKEVIDRLNAAGGGAITAGLVARGNGIFIRDNTAGAGTPSIERVNLSPAIDGLGLNVVASGNQLIGHDVNPVRVQGTFSALLELRNGLTNNDRATISTGATKLEAALSQAEKVHGELASQAHAMDERANRADSETTAAQVLQSNVRDVDLTEAMVRFSQLQTALQANMQTAARVMNLSLLDYLR